MTIRRYFKMSELWIKSQDEHLLSSAQASIQIKEDKKRWSIVYQGLSMNSTLYATLGVYSSLNDAIIVLRALATHVDAFNMSHDNRI